MNRITPALVHRQRVDDWADALPRILAKIDDVLKLPDITVAQAKEIQSIADRVGAVFTESEKQPAPMITTV